MDLLFQSKYEFNLRDKFISVGLNKSYLASEFLYMLFLVSITLVMTLIYSNDTILYYSISLIGLFMTVRLVLKIKQKPVLKIDFSTSYVYIEGKEWCEIKDLAKIYITTSSDLDENGETTVYFDAKYKTSIVLKEDTSISNSSCIDFCENIGEKLHIPVEIKEATYLP